MSNILFAINPNITIDDSAIRNIKKILTPLYNEMDKLSDNKVEIQEYIRRRFSENYAKLLINHYIKRILKQPKNRIYQKDAIIDYIIVDIVDKMGEINEELTSSVINDEEISKNIGDKLSLNALNFL